MNNLFLFFSNYWHNQLDTINSNIHDPTNLGYTYLLLAIVIKLFAKIMVELIELPIDPMEMAEDTPFLARYFPNIFAEGLVPLNPRRWPAFAAGSAMGSDMPEFGDKI